MTRKWKNISTAPRDETLIRLLIPYDRTTFTEKECTDIGFWSIEDKCFRFTGDDGPDDIQPTHWDEYNV
jgi:hypothetical protein